MTTKNLAPIHPELHELWRKFPRLPLNRWSVRPIQWLSRRQPGLKAPPGVRVDPIRTQDGPHPLRLRVYRPESEAGPTPVLLWMHGGGYVIGAPQQNDRYAFDLVAALGITVVSVDYRLAPQHPFPAPLDDCYSALRWVYHHAPGLGVDPERIAIGGASAGGGLAASLVQRAFDSGEVKPVFQLLVYPMLDDRSVLRANLPHQDLFTWDQKSNRLGWEAYLNHPCGLEQIAAYAAPARRADLRGLPPAWIGVGTLDLFHDEDACYAQRLRACGVACELVIVPGAYHGFDVFDDDMPVIKDFRQAQIAALRKNLSST